MNDLDLAAYHEFIASKALTVAAHGFEPTNYTAPLFNFQRDVTRLACKLGRFCIFSECGTGKSPMQLEWASQVCNYTQERVLILAPLAVSHQTVKEAAKFGIEGVSYASRSSQAKTRITITNYQKLQHFNPDDYVGIVLDECFAPNTLVDVVDLDGRFIRKEIQNIKVGETIQNASGLDIVSDIHRREVPYAVKISVGGRNITCSPNHPLFTRRGWVGARDLVPLDEILATSEAMRLVQRSIYSTTTSDIEEQILRDILLSEMAHVSAGDYCESSCASSSEKTRSGAVSMAALRTSECRSRSGANTCVESFVTAGSAGKDLPHIESNGPRTFRAWGQWPSSDRASAVDDGCSWQELDTGLSYITGPTNAGVSIELQSRHRRAQSKNRYRSGWILTRQQKRSGQEEGRKTAFTRVDGIEILKQGHSELDQWRDAAGHIYFYDIGGTQHPSFSVNGLLVHNSSILKSFDGKTRTAIIESFSRTPYRLAASATPSPNDIMELGNHAEFLGIMSHAEMLSMFFVHDGGDTSKWRLKGHAQEKFWEWVCTWAVTLRKPSDLGYEDGKFLLPPLNMHHHTVETNTVPEGVLFVTEAQTLSDRRNVRRASMSERVAETVKVVRSNKEQWLVWCDLNMEQDALERVFGDDCVSIRGATPDDERTPLLELWLSGKRRVMISKPSIFGFGLNLQSCHNIAFVGLSDSFEAYYQAIRRCWRFGQTQSVECHIIASSAEGAVTSNILRKEKDATQRIESMVRIMRDKSMEQLKQVSRQSADYNPQIEMKLPEWLQGEA